MSTANFRRVPSGYPFLVWLNERWSCPQGDGSSWFDDASCRDDCERLNDRIELFSVGLKYHKIETLDGYYEGIQINIEVELTEEDVQDMTNAYAHDMYGLNRSQLKKAIVQEKARLIKELKAIQEEFGLTEILEVGRFSNGEAIYQKV